MRKALAVGLSVAIQAAALRAPLVHAHPDEHATGHHGGRIVHTHFAGHAHSHAPIDGPSVSAGDHDRAVFLNTFIAVAPSSLPLDALTEDVFGVPSAAERHPHRTFAVVHGHDPPWARSLSSRAPPAFLS